MSSPSTAAYLHSGELALSLPATMQLRSQFRFISKESGGAATTAAQIGCPTAFALAIPAAPCLRFALSSLDPAVCSSLPSRVARAYTAVVPPLRSTASRTARAASVREAPVVIRSSTSTTRPPRSSRAPPAATSRASARLRSRCRESSPDWSATARRCRSTAATWADVPLRRSSPAAASAIRRTGSCPRARTAHRADGTGTSSTDTSPCPIGAPPPQNDTTCTRRPPAGTPCAEPSGSACFPAGPQPPSGRTPQRPVSTPACPVSALSAPTRVSWSPARTAPAKAAPRGPASARAPRSLWARSAARTSSAYGAAAYTAGSPGGSGTGRTRHGASPLRVARHSWQSTVRGVPQPPHSAGSTRSVRSCHHPRMPITVPTPEPADHPCGKLPVDNSGQVVAPRYPYG